MLKVTAVILDLDVYRFSDIFERNKVPFNSLNENYSPKICYDWNHEVLFKVLQPQLSVPSLLQL